MGQKLSITSLKEVPAANVKLKEKYKKHLSESSSEMEWLAYGSFIFYKEFMSSQDGENCAFHPSCSEYALDAIRQKGIIKGGTMFFDRFTRCNSPTKGYYLEDAKRMRYLDPIK